MKFKYVSLLLFISMTSSALSQSKDTLDSAFSGMLSAEGLYQSGNTSKMFIQGKGEIKYDTKNTESILSATLGYGESKGKKDDNFFSSYLTGDFFVRHTFTPFLLQITEYSFAKGIDLRSQTGGGLKYTFIKSTIHKSSVSAAIIFDYTKLADKPGNYDSEEMRLSLRFKTRNEIINERLIFSLTVFYQPSIADLSNSNIRADVSAEIPIVKKIYLKSSYLYSFESVVSVGRKRMDNKLVFGMGIGFGS